MIYLLTNIDLFILTNYYFFPKTNKGNQKKKKNHSDVQKIFIDLSEIRKWQVNMRLIVIPHQL